MPVEHAPHRRINRIPVAGDGLHVASQKRAQRGDEIPPVDVRGGQRQLIHIRPDSYHAVMGERHRVRPPVRSAGHAHMRVREDTCRGLQARRLFAPILRIPVAWHNLADVSSPCGAIRFRRVHHVGRAFPGIDVDKPAGQCSPSSSGIQFSTIGRRFPFGTVRS